MKRLKCLQNVLRFSKNMQKFRRVKKWWWPSFSCQAFQDVKGRAVPSTRSPGLWAFAHLPLGIFPLAAWLVLTTTILAASMLWRIGTGDHSPLFGLKTGRGICAKLLSTIVEVVWRKRMRWRSKCLTRRRFFLSRGFCSKMRYAPHSGILATALHQCILT